MISRRTRQVLGLVLVLAAATGCFNQVPVPPPDQDQPPVITIDSFPVSGDVNPQNRTDSGIVDVSLGATVMVSGSAVNAGGVKRLNIEVNQNGQRIFSTSGESTPAADGTVPNGISILGTDGSGHAGNIAMTFTMSQSPAEVQAIATNYNGMSTSITVTYQALVIVVPPPSPTPSATPTATLTAASGVDAFNCAATRRSYWLDNDNPGSPLAKGSLPSQRPTSGTCPPTGAVPIAVDFTENTREVVRAVDSTLCPVNPDTGLNYDDPAHCPPNAIQSTIYIGRLQAPRAQFVAH